MKDSTISFKIKIFISSRCADENQNYKIVRSSLKILLEETGLAQVYVFEDPQGARSDNVVSNYKSHLRSSDVCIFIIDNGDGISSAVLEEVRWANDWSKKCLYFFCSEKSREKTDLEKELRHPDRERICQVEKFEQVTEKVYSSVLNDIIDKYRLDYPCIEENLEKNELSIDTLPEAKFSILEKQTFKNFNYTEENFSKFMQIRSDGATEVKPLDRLCGDLLDTVLCNKGIDGFNFPNLSAEVLALHEDNIKAFIEKRITALSQYCFGELEKCSRTLLDALDMEGIPNWLRTDLIIDLRNIQQYINKQNNKSPFETEAQKLLNDSKEPVYFPIIDRLISDYFEQVLKDDLKAQINGPYTRELMSPLRFQIKTLTTAFVVAVCYGSLTQIILLPNRIINMLVSYLLQYEDNSLKVELIRLLILAGEQSELNKLFYSKLQLGDTVDPEDINLILNSIECLPFDFMRIKAKFLLFNYFGLYFSDQQFTAISDGLLEYLNLTLQGVNIGFSILELMLSSLKMNISRLKQSIILSIINKIIEKKYSRFYDTTFQIITLLDYQELHSDEVSILITTIENYVKSDSSAYNKWNYFGDALLSMRKKITDVKLCSRIDDIVLNTNPAFYNGDYSLEVRTKDATDQIPSHIDRYIRDLQKFNERQGKDGIFTELPVNPLIIIRNMFMNFEQSNFESLDLDSLLNTIRDTLYNPNQSIDLKVSAIQLLIVIKQIFTDKEQQIDQYYHGLMANISAVQLAHDLLFQFDTNLTLEFNLLVLQLCFRSLSIPNLISGIAKYEHQSSFEKIQSLKAIINYLKAIDCFSLGSVIWLAIYQYAFGFTSIPEKDIQYYAVKVLLMLCKTKDIGMTAQQQISILMDDGLLSTRVLIIKQFSFLYSVNESIANYILQKGIIDKNYIVRVIAKRMEEQQNASLSFEHLSSLGCSS